MVAMDTMVRLYRAGVRIELVEGRLHYVSLRGGIPEALKTEIAWQREELVRLLRRRGDALGQLFKRIRRGMDVLCDLDQQARARHFQDMHIEAQILTGIDVFDALESMARDLFGHQGCVMGDGQRCPEDAPVACRACAEHTGPHFIEEV